MTDLTKLREKLDKQRPLKVNPMGEIVEENSKEPGTVVKPQRWY